MNPTTRLMRTVWACSCGAVWRGTIHQAAREGIRQHWASAHHGTGHEPTTVTKANRARAKADAMSWAVERGRV